MSIPSHYAEVVKTFRILLNDSIKVSQFFANRDLGKKRYWLSTLYTRLINISVAINQIIPEEDKRTTCNHSWDFGPIASLTRDFIECFHGFYYIGVDNVSDIEWQLRINVLNLHDCSRRMELFRLMGSTEGKEDFEIQIEELTNKIKNNEHFLKINPELRKEILKYKRAYLLNRNEIEKRIDPTNTTMQWYYMFLSFQTHSFPVSYYRMKSEGRGSGVENEVDKGYIILALETLNEYFLKGIKYMIDTFPDNKNVLSDFSKTKINNTI